jgi:phosphoglycerol transferase MdoB-like AlkP superfamily enzyme
MENGFNNFLSSLRILLVIFITGFIILLISRFFFLFVYGDFSDLSGYGSDLVNAFIMGARFDVKILTFCLFPLALLSFTQLYSRKKTVIDSFYYKVSIIYGTIVLFFITLISIIDFNFFKFFNTRISILFFGILEDDATAVLKSIWTDYPVVLFTIFLIVFSILIYFLLKRLLRKDIKADYLRNLWLRLVFIFFFLGLYFLGLRGSVRMFPLGVSYTTISKNSFINTLTVNGIFSLKAAYSDKKSSKINTNIPSMLKRYGFKTPEEAIACYLGIKIIDSVNLSNNLLSTTPADSLLISNPPNVVFVLMESMNNYYFDLNSSETNVLGKLEEQMHDCYVFRNFLSAGNLTIFSLEGILAGTPIAPISQSVYQNRPLSSSVAKPFKEKGYETSFITGGDMGWRSLDKFINNQYFDVTEGKSTLNKIYPEAYTCEWGVHDEFLFDRILQILKNTSGKPQFIVGFTISNHTPYETPGSYNHYPLKINTGLKSRLKTTPEIAYKNFLAYQYANNCLGQFIENIRNSSLGENTIIVATGDHTNQTIFDFTDKDMMKKYSVPLIIYVPEKYRPRHPVDTARFGSHKDIFPTIFNLALSDATYLNTGINLLSAGNKNNFGIYCFSLAINSSGCVDFKNAPLFYSWESDRVKSLIPINVLHDIRLDSLLLKARAYVASMDYYIMAELKSKKVGE